MVTSRCTSKSANPLTDDLALGDKFDPIRRALDAEDARDEALKRINDLEHRLKAAINADPTTASRALSWIGRAERSEALVAEVLRYVRQRSISQTDLPGGWVARAQAQMKSVEILNRDLAPLAEKPEESWEQYTERESGRRGIIRHSG